MMLYLVIIRNIICNWVNVVKLDFTIKMEIVYHHQFPIAKNLIQLPEYVAHVWMDMPFK